MGNTVYHQFMIRYGVLVALLVLSAGCSKLMGAVEEEIEQRAGEAAEDGRLAAPGDVPDEPSETEVEPTISINSLQPNRGSTDGGDLVEIIGFGFTSEAGMPEPTLQVTFGPNGTACTQVTVVNDTSLQCITPAYPLAERVTVRVIKSVDGAAPEVALLEAAYEYFYPVSLTDIEPNRGPTDGGTVMLAFGNGFVTGTTVRFGSEDPVEATVVDSQTLTVSTPPMPRGTYAVTVTNINGSATLQEAFRTFEPVDAHHVTPFASPLAGGIQATLHGTGFIDKINCLVGKKAI